MLTLLFVTAFVDTLCELLFRVLDIPLHYIVSKCLLESFFSSHRCFLHFRRLILLQRANMLGSNLTFNELGLQCRMFEQFFANLVGVHVDRRLALNFDALGFWALILAVVPRSIFHFDLTRPLVYPRVGQTSCGLQIADRSTRLEVLLRRVLALRQRNFVAFK